MSESRWTPSQLEGFSRAAQSLKLYRRAELQSDADGSSLIEALYVDPQVHDHILQTTLLPNTTFIIGRKGTGKSTIFQRSQHALRQVPNCISAYIDIKTIFESSQVEPSLLLKIEDSASILPKASLERLLLYRSFLRAVILEIQAELKKKVKGTLWERIRQHFFGSFEELFEDLDDLLDDADGSEFVSILALRNAAYDAKIGEYSENINEGKIDLSISATPSGKVSVGSSNMEKYSSEEERRYSDVLMRIFNINQFILRIKALLSKIRVRHLYIFVDDFSELPETAMRIVVDTLLAPLNNWSEEFIKFKVAAYPGRIYYGAIDKMKVDELDLDIYSLYGGTDVSDMEDKAIDFTRRLVERRLEYYCNCQPDLFLDTRNEEIWRLLFYATMANPRNLGYILYYLYEDVLIRNGFITATAIRNAAKKYYEEKIEPYFSINKFLHETFAERSSIFSLKELLESIIVRARDLRSNRIHSVMREISGRAPTSHFHMVSSLDALLQTLELNFFLTKYYSMSDRDARKVSVFALNYGLCQKYSIEFGRPTGRREYRVYFIERIFDYTPVFEAYLKSNQEIICDGCGHKVGIDDLPALRLYKMACPSCHNGTCHVVNLSRKYGEMLKSIDEELLLPQTELGILQTLRLQQRPLYAAEIAGELDCSYQLVGRRGKFLADRGLVDRRENDQGRRQFLVTELAINSYFERRDDDNLGIVPVV